MFMSKFLISCALIVAAQASYAPGPVLGGYVAQIQPAATLSVSGYGGHGGYGGAPGYGIGNGYGNGAINSNALKLAGLALSLPSAGAPIPATIAYPNYATTSYSAPALHAQSYGSPVYGAAEPATASTAAAAASKVAPNSPRTAYAPVSSYGSHSPY